MGNFTGCLIFGSVVPRLRWVYSVPKSMMRNHPLLVSILLALSLALPGPCPAQTPASKGLGIFEAATDIGATRPGTTLYDPATASYRVTGGGADLWGAADQFHFTWLKLSGDATLSSDIHFAPNTADPTAKAILIFRQSLDPDSPYADAAIHADGHITLQFRVTAGGLTEDRNSPRHGATRLHIARKGDKFTLYAGPQVSQMEPDPAPVVVILHDPVYVGIGVCARNAGHLETATFSNVKLDRPSRTSSAH